MGGGDSSKGKEKKKGIKKKGKDRLYGERA